MSGTLDPQNALWRIPVEGGDEEVVVEGYRSSHGSWDLTAEGLYFVDQEPSSSGTNWVVRFQGFNRPHATEVARLGGLPSSTDLPSASRPTAAGCSPPRARENPI